MNMDFDPDQNIQDVRFAQEYVIDFNAVAAAARCGLPRNKGHKLVHKPEVQALIKWELEQRAKGARFDADRVLHELARLAFFDPRKLFNPDGSPKRVVDLDDDTAAAIAVLDVQESYTGTGPNREFTGYTKRYRMHDKNSAITNCMRHLGLFKDVVVHTGANGGDIRLTVDAAASLTKALKEHLKRASDS